MLVARMLTVLAALLAASVFAAAPAGAESYAPLTRPGPEPSVPESRLAQTFQCSSNIGSGKRAILLLHGTGADTKINWSWNHIPQLNKLRIPWCAIDMPLGGTGDLQHNAEYTAYAIRQTFSRSGRRIGIIGHSQGGMSPRWVLRFWPDTRAMIDDLVGYAPPNHGSTGADGLCPTPQPCSPANYQYKTASDFNKALNSRAETFAGISYTNVYTRTDFIATPNQDDSGTSSLHTGAGWIANIATQDVCPGATSEHLGLAYDPAAWAIAYDALTHDGPAVETRVPDTACLGIAMPGVNPVTFGADAANAAAQYAASPSAPDVTSEPPLKCYTLEAGCPHAPPALRLVSRILSLRRSILRVRLRCDAYFGERCVRLVRILYRKRTVARRIVRMSAGRTAVVRFRVARANRRRFGPSGGPVPVVVMRGSGRKAVRTRAAILR